MYSYDNAARPTNPFLDPQPVRTTNAPEQLINTGMGQLSINQDLMVGNHNKFNTDSHKAEALARMEVQAMKMFGTFNKEKAADFFYAVNGDIRAEGIPETHKLFYPEQADDLAIVSSKKVHVSAELWKDIQAYRSDRLELISDEIGYGSLSGETLKLVNDAVKKSNDSVEHHPDGSKSFNYLMGELSFISDKKHGHQPLGMFISGNDNSGSMFIEPGQEAPKGSLITIPDADMQTLHDLRDHMMSKIGNYPRGVMFAAPDSKDGFTSLRSSRVEEQFIGDLSDFRMMKAAAGDRMAGPADLDWQGNLKPEAIAQGKLAFFSVPLITGNREENVKVTEGRGANAQYEVKKKYLITSERDLFNMYKNEYPGGGTPLASVYNGMNHLARAFLANNPQMRASVKLSTDGAESGTYNNSRTPRKAHEVVNEILNSTLDGEIRVSLCPIIDEEGDDIFAQPDLISAMNKMVKDQNNERAKTFHLKGGMSMQKGSVGAEILDGKSNGAAWTTTVDSVTAPGFVDANDDSFVEQVQDALKAILSLPFESPSDCDRADHFFQRLKDIVTSENSLTNATILTPRQLGEKMRTNRQQLTALQAEIHSENPTAIATAFTKSLKRILVTQKSDNEDDLHLSMLANNRQKYVLQRQRQVGHQAGASAGGGDLPPGYGDDDGHGKNDQFRPVRIPTMGRKDSMSMNEKPRDTTRAFMSTFTRNRQDLASFNNRVPVNYASASSSTPASSSTAQAELPPREPKKKRMFGLFKSK